MPDYLKDGDILLLFANTHRVLQGERILEDNNIPFETIPKPSEISNKCGMAIRIRKEPVENINGLFNSSPELGLQIFHVTNEGYMKFMEGDES